MSLVDVFLRKSDEAQAELDAVRAELERTKADASERIRELEAENEALRMHAKTLSLDTRKRESLLPGGRDDLLRDILSELRCIRENTFNLHALCKIR